MEQKGGGEKKTGAFFGFSSKSKQRVAPVLFESPIQQQQQPTHPVSPRHTPPSPLLRRTNTPSPALSCRSLSPHILANTNSSNTYKKMRLDPDRLYTVLNPMSVTLLQQQPPPQNEQYRDDSSCSNPVTLKQVVPSVPKPQPIRPPPRPLNGTSVSF